MFWNVEADREQRCQFLAVGNCINFRFWSVRDSEVVPASGLLQGESFRGAMYMWRALRISTLTGQLSLDAEQLADLTDEEFLAAFRDEQNLDPLLPGVEERVENLRDFGRRLADSWGGLFVNVVDEAEGSLDRFTSLCATFRAFDDPIKKLTMVNAIMLSGSGLASFDQPAGLGIDYQLMKQALRQGLLQLSPAVERKIRAGEILTSSQSFELRNATLAALNSVAAQSALSTDLLDNIYWGNRGNCTDADPACRSQDERVCPFEEGCDQLVDLGRPLEITRYY